MSFKEQHMDRTVVSWKNERNLLKSVKLNVEQAGEILELQGIAFHIFRYANIDL